MEKVPPQEFESWFWHTSYGLRAAYYVLDDGDVTAF